MKRFFKTRQLSEKEKSPSKSSAVEPYDVSPIRHVFKEPSNADARGKFIHSLFIHLHECNSNGVERLLGKYGMVRGMKPTLQNIMDFIVDMERKDDTHRFTSSVLHPPQGFLVKKEGAYSALKFEHQNYTLRYGWLRFTYYSCFSLLKYLLCQDLEKEELDLNLKNGWVVIKDRIIRFYSCKGQEDHFQSMIQADDSLHPFGPRELKVSDTNTPLFNHA